MRKLYRLLALVVVPIFVFHLVDTIQHMNPSTGFYTSSNGFLRAFSLLAAAAAAGIAFLRTRQFEDRQFKAPDSSFFATLLFALSGIAVALASALQLINVFEQASFQNIFMSKKALYLAGFTTSHFRIEFWSSLVGFCAAAWFIYAGWCLFQDPKQLAKGRLFNGLPVIWYGLRAISDFSLSPVNPHNTLIITYIAVSLMLAMFYLRFTRYMTLEYQPGDFRRLVLDALLVFIFTISFKLPIAVILPYQMDRMLLAIADTLTALTAFVVTDRIIKGGVVHEEQEVD